MDREIRVARIRQRNKRLKLVLSILDYSLLALWIVVLYFSCSFIPSETAWIVLLMVEYPLVYICYRMKYAVKNRSCFAFIFFTNDYMYCLSWIIIVYSFSICFSFYGQIYLLCRDLGLLHENLPTFILLCFTSLVAHLLLISVYRDKYFGEQNVDFGEDEVERLLHEPLRFEELDRDSSVCEDLTLETCSICLDVLDGVVKELPDCGH
jgi:hypothetical protein